MYNDNKQYQAHTWNTDKQTSSSFHTWRFGNDDLNKSRISLGVRRRMIPTRRGVVAVFSADVVAVVSADVVVAVVVSANVAGPSSSAPFPVGISFVAVAVSSQACGESGSGTLAERKVQPEKMEP